MPQSWTFPAGSGRSLRATPGLGLLAVFLLALPSLLNAAELTPETAKAWDQYVQWANAKVQRELSDHNIFLIQNTLPGKEKASIQRQIGTGEIYVQRRTDIIPVGAEFGVPDGEIHHWWGTIQLRNVSLARLLQFLQDYGGHAGKFTDVERSRLISKDGNHYRFYFRLRRTKSFVTAYYNTEQECFYTLHDSNRASSQSTATRIAQLEDPGTRSEREKTPGNDDGYLWRLVSWWRFEQRGTDVIVELESASLSRDIPIFLKFIPRVSQYIRSTPKETLESVLTSIRISMAKPNGN
jgi:hypothetical protein